MVEGGYKFLIDEPNIVPSKGFDETNDIFGYQEFGQSLSNIFGAGSESIVIILDGPWGSGKSVFARQVSELMRGDALAVLELDAFAMDHHDDPFVPMSAAIYAHADKADPHEGGLAEVFLSKAAYLGKTILPSVMRAGLAAGTAGILTTETVKDLGEVAKVAIESTSDEVEKQVSDRLTSYLKDSAREEQAVDDFRESLSQLAATMSESQKLVVVIDELDRCRPDFALQFLERIKHLYGVPNVKFLIVTNMNQIGSYVNRIYGENVDAESYLQKFYHFHTRLPSAVIQSHSKERYIASVARQLGLTDNENWRYWSDSLSQQMLRSNCTLRDIERILMQSKISLMALGGSTDIPIGMITALCILKVKYSSKWEKIVDKGGKIADFPEIFSGEDWEHAHTSFVASLKTALGEELDEIESRELGAITSLRFRGADFRVYILNLINSVRVPS